jgi:predicted ABC-type ATPase
VAYRPHIRIANPIGWQADAMSKWQTIGSEIRFFSQRRVSFAFETTLSGRSYLSLIQRLKNEGYKVHLFFLVVEGVDVALSRIKERVLKGGHDVPETVVRRRFTRSISNFFREYSPLADSWYLFDNTSTKPVAIALGKEAHLRIIDQEAYQRLVMRYGKK